MESFLVERLSECMRILLLHLKDSEKQYYITIFFYCVLSVGMLGFIGVLFYFVMLQVASTINHASACSQHYLIARVSLMFNVRIRSNHAITDDWIICCGR